MDKAIKAVETYLKDLSRIRSSGAATDETSYYTPFANLLNEIGSGIKPKVRCIINIKNRGAGLPDGGLFTPDQFQKASDTDPLPGQLPSRGVIEIKGTGDEVATIADSKQVTKYWGKYGLVLVTNYRDFVLIGKDPANKPIKLESYRLAENEADFWSNAAHPRAMAQAHGKRLAEYLERVLRHAAPLASPEDVAWYLASYAKEAQSRIEMVDLPALSTLRSALEESLGIKFEGEKGEHFFRSTLVQTLFYGVFSAWVLWCKESRRNARFEWRLAEWSLHVPIIRVLFEQIATPSKLEPLGLVEVLNWTAAVLHRVREAEFFSKFEEEYAVQYFYEPFLKAFDPILRKELGVWYTPTEIVQYQVGRVDTVLREELGIEDGLADKRVYVLDPCCGTGAYLIETLKRIAKTLNEKGGDVLTGEDLKEAAMKRIFGFEILPAPFVVSHLQLGLLLKKMGAPFSEDERAGVYLTNALTGWEPPKEPKTHLLFPEMEEERDAADKVKQEEPILVILGNPPYNAFAGVSPKEEQGLVEPYKEGLISEWGIKKFNLDDLYVRFFRLAEKRITEKSGEGIISFISNFSYLGDPSFVVMRKRFLNEFDCLWFDSMNGDSRETGKRTPEGKPDPSVFSTKQNPAGIKVGTAVSLMVRKKKRSKKSIVHFRQFWGKDKRAKLVESLKNERSYDQYKLVIPKKSNRFSFHPSDVSDSYLAWPKIIEFCSIAPMNGLMEKRGGALIDIGKTALEKRMQMYYDPKIDWEMIRALKTGLSKDAARFRAKKARDKILNSETYKANHLRHYAIRPFENRWCYYSSVRPLWNEPRPDLWAQCWKGNGFLMTRPAGVAHQEGVPFYFTVQLGDNDFLRGHAYYFPFRLSSSFDKKSKDSEQTKIFPEAEEAELVPNLSAPARKYLAHLGIKNTDTEIEIAELIWMHALAIGYSRAYLSENADGIRGDWPRIPLPNSEKTLLASAKLGRQIAALLDTENEVNEITNGAIRPELKSIAIVSKSGGGTLNIAAGELDLTAGWGNASKGGATMPGKGKIVGRAYNAEEKAAIKEGAKALNLSFNAVLELLGKTTYDIYINDIVYWKNIPVNVWAYTIGGYQVIKKWLSYREKKLLGRSLTKDEAREVTNMARRISAILLMEPSLDSNYQNIKDNAYPWQSA